MSGLMLYSNWQVHEGKPSLFGGTPVSAPAPAEKSTNKADLPAQISGAPTIAAAPIIASGAIESSEKFTLKNDVLILEVSANGANAIHAKLLKALTADNKPIELFQYTPNHKYFARSGLISLN